MLDKVKSGWYNHRGEWREWSCSHSRWSVRLLNRFRFPGTMGRMCSMQESSAEFIKARTAIISNSFVDRVINDFSNILQNAPCGISLIQKGTHSNQMINIWFIAGYRIFGPARRSVCLVGTFILKARTANNCRCWPNLFLMEQSDGLRTVSQMCAL